VAHLKAVKNFYFVGDSQWNGQGEKASKLTTNE
jgi:hypothetical protein